MNDEEYGKKVIKEFLNEVEMKLPIWLKGDPEESAKVLKELEEHIEDKIEALEQGGKSRAEAVHTAIAEMGSPAQITREYRRRGTPKYYITEELWPEYLNVLKIAAIILGVIVAVWTIINTIIAAVSVGEWWIPILQGLQGFVLWGLVIVAIITMVFVGFSYEGLLPSDFKKMFKQKETARLKAQAPPKTTIERAKFEEKHPYPKGVEKRSDLIAGGIFTFIFAIFAISQPFTTLNALLNPLFLQLILAIGVFWLLSAIFELIHSGFISWSFTGNRALYPIRAIISLASIVVLAQFLIHPEIFPIFWWSESGFTILSIAPEFFWIYYLILSLGILGTVIGAIHKVYRAAVLKSEEFLEA
jgi:hypothetical protein